jgi:uncharacterized membrane protein
LAEVTSERRAAPAEVRRHRCPRSHRLLTVWSIQHRGILRTARIQTVLTIGSLTSLLLVTLIRFITGDVVAKNFSPFTPMFIFWVWK